VPSTPRRDRFPGPRRTALLGFRPLRHSPAGSCALSRAGQVQRANRVSGWTINSANRVSGWTINTAADPVSRGFRATAPSALEVWLPPRRFAPCCAWRSPSASQRPWGSPFRALLPPNRGDPSRGLASPAVQRPRPQAEPSRLQRFIRWTELPKQPVQLAPTASAVGPVTRGGERRTGSNGNRNPADEPCPPGCSPLQGVLLRRLGADKRPKPFLPFDRERSLRFHSRAGFQGFGVRRKRLVSLETAGPPGVLHLFA